MGFGINKFRYRSVTIVKRSKELLSGYSTLQNMLTPVLFLRTTPAFGVNSKESSRENKFEENIRNEVLAIFKKLIQKYLINVKKIITCLYSQTILFFIKFFLVDRIIKIIENAFKVISEHIFQTFFGGPPPKVYSSGTYLIKSRAPEICISLLMTLGYKLNILG